MERWQHQIAALEKMGDRPEFALFMEQRTGKSPIVVWRAADLFSRQLISGVLIVAPNGVHKDWLKDQFTGYWDLGSHGYIAAAYSSSMRKKEREELELVMLAPGRHALPVMTINIEAIRTKKGYDACARFCKGRRVLLALDESHGIKTPSAAQTRAAYGLARMSAYRMILTGTEITQGPLDFYSQFQFLRPGILGCKNFAVFRARFAEWRERQIVQGGNVRRFQELVRYKNLDELKALVAEHSFQKRRRDCKDMPQAQYLKRTVILGPEQRSTYDLVRERVLAELETGETMTTPHQLTKLMRLSQVAGGFFAVDGGGEPKPLPNAKLTALMDEVENVPGDEQIIIWARFVAELNAIDAALSKEYGPTSCARYWGEINNAERAALAAEFKASRRRFMIAQPKAGGKGHDWAVANTVIYFSNDFSWEARSQSEDRAQHMDKAESVDYIDLVAEDTIDEKLIEALHDKKSMAEFFKDASARELLL
jgi:SNF2 family DNA or RNA helicase